MKKVIDTPIPQDTILLSEVLKAKSPLIGFNKVCSDKITLIPTEYDSKLYFARCADGWERGNGYDPCGADQKTIGEWQQFFQIYHFNSEMFLFDSPKELFKWLSE